jgi:molybdate transport system ATP-binding protein
MLETKLVKRLAVFSIDVSFEVGDEVLALVGPSGSGKSMSLKMLAGIERPDSGLIRLNGQTLLDTDAGIDLPPQHRRFGYVPQQYALFPHLSALDNVAFPLRNGLAWRASEARGRAAALLAEVGLAERGEAKPNRLSGGQQQRVALARALALEPRLLLLDEPFAALDALVRAELREQFRDVQRRAGVPALFVTHDLEEATTVASRLAIVIDGTLQQVGPTRQVIERPVNRRVAELVQSRNILAGRVSRDGEGWTLQTAIGAIPVRTDGLREGEAVDLVIRPDNPRIIRPDRPFDAASAFWTVDGRVIELTDHGLRYSVAVAIGSGRLDLTFTPSTVQRHGLVAGKELSLGIATDELHVMRPS